MSIPFKRIVLALGMIGLIVASAEAADQAIPLRPTGVVANEFIVVFNDNVADPAALARSLARTHGLRVGFVYAHAVKGFSASIPAQALSGLARNPGVAYIEPDQWVQAWAQSLPTGVHRIFADANPNITIDGNDDWRVDVDVAVIDTGIDLDHPDLNVVSGVSCMTESGPAWNRIVTCGPGGDDDHYHGSHVAGTIGAIDNDLGVVGVAPGARLHAVKVLNQNGSGKMSWVIAGVDYVTAQTAIEVANMSLGGGDSPALCDAIHGSVVAGVTYAVAAGNSDADASNYSPANCADAITVSALADFDGLPGALGDPTCRTDGDDTLASFSNWGTAVEIAAPGVCIRSTWSNGGYGTISGTSMASPHVAGAAALRAATGNYTPAEIRATLIAEGNLNWTDDSGDGVKEPLLGVSNSAAFNPATVAGESGTLPPVNNPPSVSWDNPAGGAAVSGTILLQVRASDTETTDPLALTVDWSSDGTNWSLTTYSSGTTSSGAIYEDSWDTNLLADGDYTLTARASDGVNPPTTAQIMVMVDNVADPAPAGVASAVVSYATSGGKNSNKHLDITVAALDGADQLVAGAEVSVVVTHASGASTSGTGLTGADGTVLFSWKNAPASGCFTSVVSADGAPLDPEHLQDGMMDLGFCRPSTSASR